MSGEENKSWIYAGGLPYELSEGDIICVFSQYGEIFEISLSRDKETGKSRGFSFIKYEDPRSCELAVDNLNGATIVGRKIKVSYANNTNAVKARKPAFIAPQQDSTMPIVDPRENKRHVEHSNSGSSMLNPDYWKTSPERKPSIKYYEEDKDPSDRRNDSKKSHKSSKSRHKDSEDRSRRSEKEYKRDKKHKHSHRSNSKSRHKDSEGRRHRSDKEYKHDKKHKHSHKSSRHH